MFRFQQGIAEGQAGGDAVFPQQRQNLMGIALPAADPSAAPDAVRRSAVDGANVAPIEKIFPVSIKQRQKYLIELKKFKQAGEMVMGNASAVHGRYLACFMLRLMRFFFSSTSSTATFTTSPTDTTSEGCRMNLSDTCEM